MHTNYLRLLRIAVDWANVLLHNADGDDVINKTTGYRTYSELLIAWHVGKFAFTRLIRLQKPPTGHYSQEHAEE
jgi:hypothetical protein